MGNVVRVANPGWCLVGAGSRVTGAADETPHGCGARQGTASNQRIPLPRERAAGFGGTPFGEAFTAAAKTRCRDRGE